MTSLLPRRRPFGLGAARHRLAPHDVERARLVLRRPRLRAPLRALRDLHVGSSPLEVAATFNLIARVEALGRGGDRGGISRLAEAVAELARSSGHDPTGDSDVRGPRRRRPRDRRGARGRTARARIPSRRRAQRRCRDDPRRGTFGPAASRAVDAPSPSRLALALHGHVGHRRLGGGLRARSPTSSSGPTTSARRGCSLDPAGHPERSDGLPLRADRFFLIAVMPRAGCRDD